MLNLDKPVNRHGTNSLKYDFNWFYGMPEGVLPFWIADMDFPSPSCCEEAIIDRAKKQVYGYAGPNKDYFAALAKWMQIRHHWTIRPEWVVPVPDAGVSIMMAVKTFTKEGDGVLINSPAYDAFASSAAALGRRIVDSPLIQKDGRYEIDFDDLEEKMKSGVALAFLCSPHNPTGRVWSKEELVRYSALARKYGVKLFIDEVHEDFCWDGHPFTPFGTLGEEDVKNAIICTSPGKTFNLGGLPIGHIFIADPDMKKAFQEQLVSMECHKINLMSVVAAQAAYEKGGEWLDSVRSYIQNNIRIVSSFLQDNLPKAKFNPPEGTYLLWIDLRAYGFSDEELSQRLIKAGLWVNMGAKYGPSGSGFIRFNAACPKSTLEEGLSRLAHALIM
jgi:cystathionine beta-lyase